MLTHSSNKSNMKFYQKYNAKFLSSWLSWRFVLNSRKSKHVKVITLTTIISLMLGVASLITVLSIMNGFTYISKNRMTNLIPHITINTFDDYENLSTPTATKITAKQSATKIKNIERIIINRLGDEKIDSVYPNLQKKAFIVNNQQLIPIWINSLPSNIIEKKLHDLKTGYHNEDGSALDKREHIHRLLDHSSVAKNYNGIVLSNSIIEKLDDKKNISIISSDNFFKFYNLEVKDTFIANDQLMGNMAFMDINYANVVFDDYNINNVNIDLINPNQAQKYANRLTTEMPLEITNWTQYVGNYFKVLDYTKQMMFLLLSCIIIVAMFNLVSTLTTVLNEKKTDLAILKTIGISRWAIIKLFLSYGFIITTIGLVLGIAGGTVLAHNITFLAGIVEKILDYQFVNPEIYFINYLPSKIARGDIFNIVSLVYIIMFLAIIYPAFRASKIVPANTLRHE